MWQKTGGNQHSIRLSDDDGTSMTVLAGNGGWNTQRTMYVGTIMADVPGHDFYRAGRIVEFRPNGVPNRGILACP